MDNKFAWVQFNAAHWLDEYIKSSPVAAYRMRGVNSALRRGYYCE